VVVSGASNEGGGVGRVLTPGEPMTGLVEDSHACCASLSRCSAPPPIERMATEGTPLGLPAHGASPPLPLLDGPSQAGRIQQDCPTPSGNEGCLGRPQVETCGIGAVSGGRGAGDVAAFAGHPFDYAQDRRWRAAPPPLQQRRWSPRGHPSGSPRMGPSRASGCTRREPQDAAASPLPLLGESKMVNGMRGEAGGSQLRHT
jgi:hypothetical protein